MQRRGPRAELRPAAEPRFVAGPHRVRCERTALLRQRPPLPQGPLPGLGARDCRARRAGPPAIQLGRRHCGGLFAAVAAPEPQRTDGRTAAAQPGAFALCAARQFAEARDAERRCAAQRAERPSAARLVERRCAAQHAERPSAARRCAARLLAPMPVARAPRGAGAAGGAGRAAGAPPCLCCGCAAAVVAIAAETIKTVAMRVFHWDMTPTLLRRPSTLDTGVYGAR